MPLPKTLMPTTSDPSADCYTVLDQNNLSVHAAETATAAGCLVARPPPLSAGVVAGVVVEPSWTERAGQPPSLPTVISRVPGTATGQARARADRESDTPRQRRR